MTVNLEQFPLLAGINSPADLRNLPQAELPKVCDELRRFMVASLDTCGGHFAGSLGAVELAVALHYVMQTPQDKLVWDVGHQAYPHKILTGRRDQLHTIRQTNGLSPFPNRNESNYDAFTTGHSSTSISAATGMALANENIQAVAIIGDGGLTGGMAFEALNHAGCVDANVLVILNDNEMSISPNVGALTNYLSRVMSGKVYTSFREGSKKVLKKVPSMETLVKRTETHVKGMITPGTIFEELGFHYFGPIDGHDVNDVISMLQNLKELKGPRFLHVVTKKGKGYNPAEKDPVAYHAVKAGFNSSTDKASPKPPSAPTYSQIFGNWLCYTTPKQANLVAITPAMREGSGMVEFAEKFPAQYIDVGIAEQHSVTLAAGIACEGKKPVVAIYSTFLQRAYDQLIHDVALQNLDVTFAIDRAGLVGGDGPTHNGSFDLSYLRCIPNMVVMTPADENEAWAMLNTAYRYPGPAAVRYPRGAGPNVAIKQKDATITIGQAEIRRQGKNTAILAFGSMLAPALQVGDKLNATVINMRFVKPLDETLIKQIAETHHLIVTVEENAIMGGAGSGVNEYLARENILLSVLNIGLPDEFIEHGDPKQLLANCGLGAVGIENTIRNKITSINSIKAHRAEML